MQAFRSRPITLLLAKPHPAWTERIQALAARLGLAELRVGTVGAPAAGDGVRVAVLIGAQNVDVGAWADACAERWWLPELDPDAAAPAVPPDPCGFRVVASAAQPEIELAHALGRLSLDPDSVLLPLAIRRLCRIAALELAAPLQDLELSQAAAARRIRAVAPLLDDLHKASLPDSQALLERLRRVLAAVDLKSAAQSLRAASAQSRSALARLLAFAELLSWMAEGGPDEDRNLAELIGLALDSLVETSRLAVNVANHVPARGAPGLPGRLGLAALLVSCWELVDWLCGPGGGGNGSLDFWPLNGKRPDRGIRLVLAAPAGSLPRGEPEPGLSAPLWQALGARVGAQSGATGREFVISFGDAGHEA